MLSPSPGCVRTLLMLRHTVLESGVALLKELRYRSANVSVTGSTRSITVASSCAEGSGDRGSQSSDLDLQVRRGGQG